MPKVILSFSIPLPSPTPTISGVHEFVIHVPVGSEIVHLDNQDGAPKIWMSINPDIVEHEYRRFIIVGSGKIIPDYALYIGSCKFGGGDLVWHLFETTKP